MRLGTVTCPTLRTNPCGEQPTGRQRRRVLLSATPPVADIRPRSILLRDAGDPERHGAESPESNDDGDDRVAHDEPHCTARDQGGCERHEEQPRLAVSPETGPRSG